MSAPAPRPDLEADAKEIRDSINLHQWGHDSALDALDRVVAYARRLEAAIQRYGSHEMDCTYSEDSYNDGPWPCSCGLIEFKPAAPAAPALVGVTEDRYYMALRSIAASSCCGDCQEARRVAQAALEGAGAPADTVEGAGIEQAARYLHSIFFDPRNAFCGLQSKSFDTCVYKAELIDVARHTIKVAYREGKGHTRSPGLSDASNLREALADAMLKAREVTP